LTPADVSGNIAGSRAFPRRATPTRTGGAPWSGDSPSRVRAQARSRRRSTRSMTPDPTATRQRRTRLLGAITAVTVGIGGLAATSASAGTVPPDPTPDLEGLVHHFLLDETSGTVLANSGSAGTPATLVNADKATLTGDGVR